jgi:hypothetical protein
MSEDFSLSDLLSSADAETELAAALVDHQLRLNRQGLAAALFLHAWGFDDLLSECLRLRRYQASDKGIVEALSSVALKKFMRGLSVSLGNK